MMRGADLPLRCRMADRAGCGVRRHNSDMVPETTDFQKRVAAAVARDRAALRQHRLYAQLGTLPQLRAFMEVHVFAVWDFMSLLKALQMRLTCVQTPWLPVGDGAVRRLVNELVLGEESDTLPEGGAGSHFELYLRAMAEAGADTGSIGSFLARLRAGQGVSAALEQSGAPGLVRDFVQHTFAVIDRGEPHELAAAFTYGREDLIPELFLELVQGLARQFPGRLQTLRYYLDRHIELDGDEHGAMGRRMVELLCAGDPGREAAAIEVARAALAARLRLWDGIAALPGPAIDQGLSRQRVKLRKAAKLTQAK